jgi:hypothetical protein
MARFTARFNAIPASPPLSDSCTPVTYGKAFYVKFDPSDQMVRKAILKEQGRKR